MPLLNSNQSKYPHQLINALETGVFPNNIFIVICPWLTHFSHRKCFLGTMLHAGDTCITWWNIVQHYSVLLIRKALNLFVAGNTSFSIVFSYVLSYSCQVLQWLCMLVCVLVFVHAGVCVGGFACWWWCLLVVFDWRLLEWYCVGYSVCTVSVESFIHCVVMCGMLFI